MNSAAVPEPWATRMVERGFTDSRTSAEVPSLRRLGEATGLHASTVSAIIRKERRPGAASIAKLVEALGPDVQDWLDLTVELGPYEPPAESALLTKSQRDALTTLIRSIAVEQRRGGGERDVRSAPNRRAGESPAPHPNDPPTEPEHGTEARDDLPPPALATDDVDLAAYAKTGPTRLQQLRAQQDAEAEGLVTRSTAEIKRGDAE